MQFIAMRALFLIWLRMCVPHGGVWQNWCHFCWCPSCCCSSCNTGMCHRMGLVQLCVRCNTQRQLHMAVYGSCMHTSMFSDVMLWPLPEHRRYERRMHQGRALLLTVTAPISADCTSRSPCLPGLCACCHHPCRFFTSCRARQEPHIRATHAALRL
jgi:hypothetical protein